LRHQFTQDDGSAEHFGGHHPIAQRWGQTPGALNHSLAIVLGHNGISRSRGGGGNRFLDVNEAELILFRLAMTYI
jgi:hypothetical protein